MSICEINGLIAGASFMLASIVIMFTIAFSVRLYKMANKALSARKQVSSALALTA